jgi:hypothetical protein
MADVCSRSLEDVMTDRPETASPSSRLEEADAEGRRAIDRDDLGSALASSSHRCCGAPVIRG